MESVPIDDPSRYSPARTHCLVAGFLLLILGALTVILDVLAHDEGIAAAMNASELREARMTKVGWWNPSHFLDSGDLLLLDELPHIDCSRGGVYFVGSSNLRMALKDWDRSPQEKALVHNLGVPGTNHLFNFQTLRYLVENEGLLRAGGEKTLIVFGVSYHCVGHEYDKTCYFATLLGRHGLYSCHTASRTVCATKVCRLSIGSGLSRRREWGAS